MSMVAIPGFSEPFSSLSHLAATVIFFFAGFVLVHRGRGNSLRVAALTLYSICVVYLFSMSGVYHLLDPTGGAREVLQRLDHSAIWSMIAGTFTPIHIILFERFFRWGVLGFVWVIAITGLVLEVVFFKNFPEILSLSLYLGLGWLGVASGWNFSRLYKEHSVRLLVLGGLSYSIGAVMEFFRWPTLIPGVIGPHEVFHVFVIVGAAFHWRFIHVIAGLAIKEQLTLVVKMRPGGELFVKAKGEAINFKALSKHEMFARLNQEIVEKYRNYTRPKAVRLQYIAEEFVDPTVPSGEAVSVDRFYPEINAKKVNER